MTVAPIFTETSGRGWPPPAWTARAMPAAGSLLRGQERVIGMEHWEKHAVACVDEFVSKIRSAEMDQLLSWLGRCESPIEKMLGAELAFISIFGSRIMLCGDEPWVKFDEWDRFDERDYRLELWPQRTIGAYRADFLLLARFSHSEAGLEKDLHRIVIECDGHEFHERTKEQAMRDRRRDREMTAAGFKVLRFTGAEIHRDPRRCKAEVVSLLTDTALGEGDEV